MAGVPAINGLYVSFFNVILYTLLGTSRHLSTGTYAIVSLIIASAVKKYAGILYPLPGSSHLAEHTTAAAAAVGNLTDYEYLATTTTGLDHHGLHGHSDSHGSAAVAGDPAFYISNDPVDGAVLIAMTLSFFAGIIQIIFGLVHVGFVTKYLSDTIVNGFTCGAAFHVIVSQIGTLLGLKLQGIHIPFVIIGVSLAFFFTFKTWLLV
jgi:MFS superfamily sulfate permease-like transporter